MIVALSDRGKKGYTKSIIFKTVLSGVANKEAFTSMTNKKE